MLPEAMVSRLDHIVQLQGQDTHTHGWKWLRPRLLGLVTLQRWWGQVGDLYSGSEDSLFAEERLPKWIRHPEARSTQVWDIISTVLILWVAFVVPYRLGFDVVVELTSPAFVIDCLIDTFFLVDVQLQFRTAYLLPTGFLEVRWHVIAKKYMRSWFLVDLVASLPLTYISMIYHLSNTEAAGGPADNLSYAKTFRMIRLAKMLRVARLKNIVGRHASLVEFSAYMNSLGTFFGILYISHVRSIRHLVGLCLRFAAITDGHPQRGIDAAAFGSGCPLQLLACIWYWLGNSHAESEDEVDGWVVRDGSTFNLTRASAGAKYATSIYTVFKLGDGMARTSGEQWFAFTSEIAISLIYGAL